MAANETNPLRSYVQAKQEIAGLIREVQHWFETQADAQAAEQCQALLVDLAEDRFNLAVVGQFKRGKSSLMNAVIGRDLLPTGLLPLTSAITTLRYGPKERVILRREGWSLEPEVPLDELADYVTERGNPGNEKGVIEARVELPVAFLRRGLHFIDTPGIGSTRYANTATTYEFLPKADAVIFVTSVDTPLSEAEDRFLQDIRQYVHKLFIVVNKIDLLADDDWSEVLDYIGTEIGRTLEVTGVQIYPLSARQALAAKLDNADGELQRSGLPALEAALAAFLANDKEQVFLLSMLERLGHLLRTGAADGEIPARPLQERLASLQASLAAGGGIDTTTWVDTDDGRGERLDALLAERRSPAGSATTAPATSAQTTCPLCAAQSQILFDFFVQLQYALVTEVETRRALAQARGLCGIHTWQFQRIASPQAISEGYAPLVEKTAVVLQRLDGVSPDRLAAGLDAVLPTPETCPACRTLHQTETALLQNFLAQLDSLAGQTHYTRAQGLCLPHRRQVYQAHPSPAVARFLLNQQIQRLEEMAEDMNGYMLKRSARRRGLQTGDEATAWQRALVKLVGERTAAPLER